MLSQDNYKLSSLKNKKFHKQSTKKLDNIINIY